jgi:hypothetical protein
VLWEAPGVQDTCGSIAERGRPRGGVHKPSKRTPVKASASPRGNTRCAQGASGFAVATEGSAAAASDGRQRGAHPWPIDSFHTTEAAIAALSPPRTTQHPTN